MSPVESRRRWASRMIRRCCEPPPTYGSAEWLALPEGCVEKVAAVVIAAEAWARGGDDLEETLNVELDLATRAHKAAEDAEYAARAEEWRGQWRHLRVVRGAYADSPQFRGEAS